MESVLAAALLPGIVVSFASKDTLYYQRLNTRSPLSIQEESKL
jgi:hypothetical protein